MPPYEPRVAAAQLLGEPAALLPEQPVQHRLDGAARLEGDVCGRVEGRPEWRLDRPFDSLWIGASEPEPRGFSSEICTLWTSLPRLAPLTMRCYTPLSDACSIVIVAQSRYSRSGTRRETCNTPRRP